MQYRIFKKSGLKVSRIGLGAEHLEHLPYEEVAPIVERAMDAGINYTDLFMASPGIRDIFGRILRGRRDKMMIAGHLGAIWEGQYARTRDVKKSAAFFEDLLRRLNTDYIDVLTLHYVDELSDFDKVYKLDGLLGQALKYKLSGQARMISLSTHNPVVGRMAAESGAVDAIMISANPVLDLMKMDTTVEDYFGSARTVGEQPVRVDEDRAAFYEACEREGVGIVVMKAFNGGWLVDERDFPLKMSPVMCLQYALDRPGVVCALAGVRTLPQLEQALAYEEATEEERDYGPSLAQAFTWRDVDCLFCNHCLPCPSGIDIGDFHRRLSAGEDVSETAAQCIECGGCEQRCPFGVQVVDHMRAARKD